MKVDDKWTQQDLISNPKLEYKYVWPKQSCEISRPLLEQLRRSNEAGDRAGECFTAPERNTYAKRVLYIEFYLHIRDCMEGEDFNRKVWIKLIERGM